MLNKSFPLHRFFQAQLVCTLLLFSFFYSHSLASKATKNLSMDSYLHRSCDRCFAGCNGPSRVSHAYKDFFFASTLCMHTTHVNVHTGQQGKSLWAFIQLCLESLGDLPGKSVKKNTHPVTFLGYNLLLSLEHWPLWLAWAWWPCPIPFHQHSGQCEQKTGALIRDAQMGRSWWQTVSCPSSLMRPLCLVHSMGICATRGGQYR